MTLDVLLVGNDARFGADVSTLLETASFRVRHAPDARAVRELAREVMPRATVVDLGPFGAGGPALVRELAALTPGRPILVLSGEREPSAILEALRAGASGCLLKHDAARHLVAAVGELLSGGAPLPCDVAHALIAALRAEPPPSRRPPIDLTSREIDVLRELARGLTYEQVAAVLDVSVNTVRTHVKTLYAKLDVCSRTEAVLRGIRCGVIGS